MRENALMDAHEFRVVPGQQIGKVSAGRSFGQLPAFRCGDVDLDVEQLVARVGAGKSEMELRLEAAVRDLLQLREILRLERLDLAERRLKLRQLLAGIVADFVECLSQ